LNEAPTVGLKKEKSKMAVIDFGGVKETVVMRKEFPMAKARKVLKDETIAVIGYGVQGPAQALNLKDNGFNVIIGQAKAFKKDWNRAKKDGWVPGETLFDIEEAATRGTIIQYLVSDAAQKALWRTVKKCLNPGDALYFSHGFSIVYGELTKVVPPEDVDVIMVAPKGSGTSVRRNFLSGAGINSSFAVFQDATGKAEQRALALGIGVGSGYLFPTTFENEVYSDLTGERGVLMGALAGVMEAQYDVLRKNGHSPSEAFNETVEELTQSLIRLVDENGMDWMFANCSATAQRGALDWRPKFKKAVTPVFKELYDAVRTGKETKRVLRSCSKPDYKEQLDNELAALGESEMWKAGAAARKLRPRQKAVETTKATKGIAGRGKN
jgi:ketol-acid reductoisomerase